MVKVVRDYFFTLIFVVVVKIITLKPLLQDKYKDKRNHSLKSTGQILGKIFTARIKVLSLKKAASPGRP